MEDIAGVRFDDKAAVGLLVERFDHARQVELRSERRDLLHQVLGQLLAGDDGIAGNVVDRLFRIELGALPTRPVENVDQVALEVQQAQLEHGEQADRSRADNDDIGFNYVFGHKAHSGMGGFRAV